MPRLLVLACSGRKHRTPRPLPAWYRYDGVLFRLCKRLQADRRFPPDVRIRILSAEHGLLTPDTPIAWYDRRLDAARAAALRDSVTRALRRAVDEEHASEVYLALGRLRRWLATPPSAGGQLHLELSCMDPSPAHDGSAAHPRAS